MYTLMNTIIYPDISRTWTQPYTHISYLIQVGTISIKELSILTHLKLLFFSQSVFVYVLFLSYMSSVVLVLVSQIAYVFI